MHEHLLVLAGDEGRSRYAYASALAPGEKKSLSFLVPEGHVLSEKRPRKFSEVDSLIKPQGPKIPGTTKKCKGVEKCRKKFG
jgi:hypothetical protein